MNYKLSEEQSIELLTHLSNYKDIIKLIHKEACEILELYYKSYVNSYKGIIRPNKKERFFQKITKAGTDLSISTTLGSEFKYIFSYNHAVLDPVKLDKLKVQHNHASNQIIQAALESPYILGKYVSGVEKSYNILLKYGTIPYIVDTETLIIFEKVKEENLENIKRLEYIGVNYEL